MRAAAGRKDMQRSTKLSSDVRNFSALTFLLSQRTRKYRSKDDISKVANAQLGHLAPEDHQDDEELSSQPQSVLHICAV